MAGPKAQSTERSEAALGRARAYLARELDMQLDVVPRATPPAPSAPPNAPAQPAVPDTLQAEQATHPTQPRGVDRAEHASHQAVTESARDENRVQAKPSADARIEREHAAAIELADLLLEPEVREAATLGALREALGDCRRCKLCNGRINIVFGVGNPSADLMFVGEGPGQDEDEQGEPFVGRAGQLLTSIITKGIGLAREDVYIANVVKCRPPNNRNPEPDEIVACEPFLQRQISIVKPRAIVTLGKFSTHVLLREKTPISKLRGRWHEYQGVPVMPTFHPAYLLRTPSDKRVVWADIQLVMQRLGIPVPERKS